MLLALPTVDVTNNDDTNIIVTKNMEICHLKESFYPQKCDADDSSISSDYTAETTSSTISNDSCDSDIGQNFNIGNEFLNKICSNGTSHASCPEKEEEMEIQFAYMIVDRNGRKSIVKSSKNLTFPPLHQMPGCCLKDIVNENDYNDKHTEVVRKESSTIIDDDDEDEEEEEASNLCSKNPSYDNTGTLMSTEQEATSFSFLKALRYIYTQISRTVFLRMHGNSSNVDKSSVINDDDKLRSEEIEIQFEKITMREKKEYVKNSAAILNVDTLPREKID